MLAAVLRDLRARCPRRLGALFWLSCALAVSLPSPHIAAQAAEAAEPVASAQEPDEWYGWQTLAADAAGLMLIGVGAGFDQPATAGMGVGMMFVGAPVAHFVHGNLERGFASLGLRITVTLLTGLGAVMCGDGLVFGDSFDVGRDEDVGCVLMVVGIVGFPGVIAIDAAALAWGPPEAPQSGDLALTPFYDRRREAAGLSLGLVF